MGRQAKRMSVPQKVYKFVQKAHLEGFFDRGEIRIGTLAEFRIPDGKDAGRSDPDEGLIRWSPGSGMVDMPSDHPFLAAIDRTGEPGEGVRIQFSEGSEIWVAGQAHVLSLSMAVSRTIVEEMHSQFGYDACYRITDLRGFVAHLSSHRKLWGWRYVANPVRYQTVRAITEKHPLTLSSDGFLKDQRFDWQREYRIAWSKKDERPTEGVILQVPGIQQFAIPISLDAYLPQ